MNCVFHSEMLKKLQGNNSIGYAEVKDIAYAMQVASGNSFAVGKTFGIFDYLIGAGEIRIENYREQGVLKIIKECKEVAEMLKEIDPSIDLFQNKDLSVYLKKI